MAKTADSPPFRRKPSRTGPPVQHIGGGTKKRTENKRSKNKPMLKPPVENVDLKCTVCDKQMISKSTLERHMLSHTLQKKFACGVCGASFTQSSNRNTHEQWVCRAEKLECTICGKLIAGPSNLQKHLQNTHKMNDRIECEVCDISMVGSMNRHCKSKRHIKAVESQNNQDEERTVNALAMLWQALV
jgi:transcription elongation factor Elf1